MKYFRDYSNFVNESRSKFIKLEDENSIRDWLDNNKIKNYVINSDLSVDVNGDLILKLVYPRRLKNIPVKFNRVAGYFQSFVNNLRTLEGFPKRVEGDCYISEPKITSLNFCPEYVGGEFTISDFPGKEIDAFPKYVGGNIRFLTGKLTSLKGFPNKINKGLVLTHNKLSSFEYFPKVINGRLSIDYNSFTSLEGCPNALDLSCEGNKLTSLKGAPAKLGILHVGYNKLKTLEYCPLVTTEFDVTHNLLTSLIGGPKSVSKSYYCDNNKLSDFTGAPEYIGGNFDAKFNNITSLKGFPKTINGNIEIGNNPRKFTTKEIKKYIQSDKINTRDEVLTYWTDDDVDDDEFIIGE